jgi:hypothetical protein
MGLYLVCGLPVSNDFVTDGYAVDLALHARAVLAKIPLSAGRWLQLNLRLL